MVDAHRFKTDLPPVTGKYGVHELYMYLAYALLSTLDITYAKHRVERDVHYEKWEVEISPS